MVPTCYVCTRPIEKPSRPVWILSPGVLPAHPSGLARHKRCAPGSLSWLASLTDSARDRFWARMFFSPAPDNIVGALVEEPTLNPKAKG